MQKDFCTPDIVDRFVQMRKADGGVSAAILFGSFARGTHHPKSDVDIIIIVENGHWGGWRKFDGRYFEVLETTKQNMFSYWEKNFDPDRHWYLWKDAKLIYDHKGEGVEIFEHAASLLPERKPWTPSQISKSKEHMNMRLTKIRYILPTDTITAALSLEELMKTTLDNWFKMRGHFSPSPKEYDAYFQAVVPGFSLLLHKYYVESETLQKRIDIAEEIVTTAYSQDFNVSAIPGNIEVVACRSVALCSNNTPNH